MFADVTARIEQASVGIVGKMLEQKRDMILRDQVACAFRPLYEDKRFGREDVVPPDVLEILGTTKTVKIQMKDWRSRRRELVNEREGGTGHLVRHAITTADRARERRLPRAELTAQRDEQRCTRGAPKALSPVDQLGFRERQMT
jgi:hypothetical protein